MRFGVAQLHNYDVSVLAMPRGEHCVEDVGEGDKVAFVIVYGCVQITRERSGQPASFCLHATPSAPLFLIQPGRYCVVAERNVLGFRGVRRKGS